MKISFFFNLIDCFYSGAQSPNHMSGTTRISKTFSGQTIIAKNSSSDRSSTYCIRPSVSIHI